MVMLYINISALCSQCSASVFLLFKLVKQPQINAILTPSGINIVLYLSNTLFNTLSKVKGYHVIMQTQESKALSYVVIKD